MQKRVDDLEAAPLRELPDLLEPGLRLVFIGFNASLHAARTGHYYSRPANRFWGLLREVGLVPSDFTSDRDAELPSLGIGMTDLVKRPTGGVDEVSREEFRAGVVQVCEKLERFRPAVVCCVGRGVFAWLAGRPSVGWGIQPTAVAGARVFVMPSTSGRANRFEPVRLEVMMALKQYLEPSSEHSADE